MSYRKFYYILEELERLRLVDIVFGKKGRTRYVHAKFSGNVFENITPILLRYEYSPCLNRGHGMGVKHPLTLEAPDFSRGAAHIKYYHKFFYFLLVKPAWRISNFQKKIKRKSKKKTR
jgi:hypothetical protein